MKSLTVQEASQDLSCWLRRAIGGEQITIHEGTCAVLLQPLLSPSESPEAARLSPREALLLMQGESRSTPEQAEQYLIEAREERFASEARREK